MIIKENALRRIWLDGRNGHTVYLMFLLGFLNFIIITYAYLIEGNTIFEKLDLELWSFGIILIILYVPISILIGRWHKRTQLRTDMTFSIIHNPMITMMIRTLLDVQTGKATKDEIEEFRKMLIKIEKGKL